MSIIALEYKKALATAIFKKDGEKVIELLDGSVLINKLFNTDVLNSISLKYIYQSVKELEIEESQALMTVKHN